MATVVVQAVVDLESLIRSIDAIPEMIEFQFSVRLVCRFSGGEITCDTVEEIRSLAEGILKRRLETKK